ncbi:DUF5606 family protein [Frigoriflavimonas asaccharolytica]|uniref:DUF5606 domain-containing protein n=1 Tax=Frigoriflavimonas asaccharolytica TaxID=2735899 RepID=A0A8J8G813_9FLAO|nr:DUF5606 domain-containing protein [Frigoriflavimonas asaccharolytica]NRS92375.1 hypothetical protein [Frigoriflavimonas asaccharolytica]
MKENNKALEKIISISGKPGLFKLVSQLKNGFIIEDVISKKKVSIGNSSQVSLLDNIAMFTFDKEVNLYEVFENVGKMSNYEATISHKSTDAELRSFMEKALPDYDTERVYVSDMKKLAQWYNTLQSAGYISEKAFADRAAALENPDENASPNLDMAKQEKVQNKTANTKAKASTGAKSNTKSTLSKKG